MTLVTLAVATYLVSKAIRSVCPLILHLTPPFLLMALPRAVTTWANVLNRSSGEYALWYREQTPNNAKPNRFVHAPSLFKPFALQSFPSLVW